MLLLGHLGCTLAAGQAGEAAYKRFSGRGFRSTAKLIDYRLLAIGSVLPDIIDKPLALLLFPDLFNGMTRNLGHTLLFAVLLFVVWRIASGSRRSFLLPLAIGSSLHLLFDAMFTNPDTLFWPFVDGGFAEAGHRDLFSGLSIPWSLPWNISWLVFSELLGSLFLARALVGEWVGRSRRTPKRADRKSVLVRPDSPPVL
jgi:membrane-bound metal-dependent hydrolase YbcI (DUF457 family)